MTDIRNTTTDYVHPTDPNLLNLHKAMQFDEAGKPVVRTLINTSTIQITGPVNILSTVTVTSTPENPVHTHITEIGTSGILTVPYMPVGGTITATQGTTPWVITGTIAVNSTTVYQGTDPWTVYGTVEVNNFPTSYEVANDEGNPLPVSKNTSTNSATNPIFVEGVNNASFFAPTQSDAFGRLRVSNPLTLFDTQNKYTDQGQFVSNLVNGGTCTYNQPSNTFLLSVSGSGSTVIRETTKTFVYQPGKSLFVLNTFAMNTATAGVTQRVGYYNTNNGIFFEANGTTLNMVIRSYSSGSIVETRKPQSEWNGDTLLGTGGPSNLSGIELRPQLAQIFWCDIEWLGVGSVRVGFVINGQFVVCHTFNHANVLGNTTTYMGTAVLPVRYEISTTGTAASMRQICSTVISEGGYSPSGTPAGRGHELASPIVLPNDQSFKPLISIRLKSTQPDAVVVPIDYSIVPVDQAVVKYRVYAKAVTTGGTWISQSDTSSVEYNLNPTAIISGEQTVSGFLISNNQSINTPQNEVFDFTDQLSRDPFTGTMYEYTIAAATLGTNIDVYASINWQEIT